MNFLNTRKQFKKEIYKEIKKLLKTTHTKLVTQAEAYYKCRKMEKERFIVKDKYRLLIDGDVSTNIPKHIEIEKHNVFKSNERPKTRLVARIKRKMPKEQIKNTEPVADKPDNKKKDPIDTPQNESYFSATTFLNERPFFSQKPHFVFEFETIEPEPTKQHRRVMPCKNNFDFN